MLWGDLEFVIFLSNCTAPIYCNVIKNSYCELLSRFAFSLPRISAPHLCNRVSHESHVFGGCSQFISCASQCVSSLSCCLCPWVFPSSEKGCRNALLYWSTSGPSCSCILRSARSGALPRVRPVLLAHGCVLLGLSRFQSRPRDLVFISLNSRLDVN